MKRVLYCIAILVLLTVTVTVFSFADNSTATSFSTEGGVTVNAVDRLMMTDKHKRLL